MAHLSLNNSQLIMGQVYSGNFRVNEVLNNPDRHCVLLYPGRNSANLSTMPLEARQSLCPPGKKLTVFVIDGTWATAKKTVNQSVNLWPLPRICFSPNKPSNFRVRKQPRPECYSTIEAIHHTIELFGSAFGFDTNARAHDSLLLAFSKMVDRQIELANSGRPSRRRPSVSL